MQAYTGGVKPIQIAFQAARCHTALINNDFEGVLGKGDLRTLLSKCTCRHESGFDTWDVQHITQGNWSSKTRFEDDGANPNLVYRRFIPKAYSACARGIILEVRFVWADVVCGTTVHHPTLALGSIQGNTNIIVIVLMDLSNGGGTRDRGRSYFNVRVGCLGARAAGLFSCFLLILLLFTAIRLNMSLFITVVTCKLRVIALFA